MNLRGGKLDFPSCVPSFCLMIRSARRAMIVDLALSVTGSQLIASVLPTVCMFEFFGGRTLTRES